MQTTVKYSPKQYADVPAAWKKAAGILRAKKPTKLTMKQELMLLRSAVIGLIGKDPEGNYRPEFIRETIADLKRKPTHTFITPEKFLNDVRNT